MAPKENSRLQARRGSSTRRGIATIWIILTVPAIWILLCVMVDVANLWVARVELKNALEAAALASVKDWTESGGGGTTAASRARGIEFALANTLVGQSLILSDNRDPGNLPNENLSCSGNLIFGATTTSSAPYLFEAGVHPDCGTANAFAVHAQATAPVSSIWDTLFGFSPGPFNVTAQATARYDCAAARPELVRVVTIQCGP